MPAIIDEKIIPSSLTVERGRFRKKPVPVEFEVRQREAAEPGPSGRSSVVLGLVGLIAINPNLIRCRLDVRKGGVHRDLRLVQDSNERVVRNNTELIVNIITKGWIANPEKPVVHSWYDRDSLNARKALESRIVPETLTVGCHVLRHVMQTVYDTGELPTDLSLTNDDIRQIKKSEHPGVYVEGLPAHSFFELTESVYR